MAEFIDIRLAEAEQNKTAIPIDQRTDVTADELERVSLPCPAKLYDGKVVAKSVSPERVLMQKNISAALKLYLRHNHIGYVTIQTGFQLWPNRPRELRLPDVAYVAKESVPETSKQFLKTAPDLAVEITSPDDTFFHVMGKVDEYLMQGTRIVWLITPPRFREVWVFAASGMRSVRDILAAPDLLPGFELPVSKIFEGIPSPTMS